MPISIFWFRRDLRIDDNHGLFQALKADYPVLPLFIFDDNILAKLPETDLRVQFLHRQIVNLDKELKSRGSCLYVSKGNPIKIWSHLIKEFEIDSVHVNCDYEPYGIERDNSVKELLQASKIKFISTNDHVIFEPGEILKSGGKPYEIFTPFSKRWLALYTNQLTESFDTQRYLNNFMQSMNCRIPTLNEMGFYPLDDFFSDNTLSLDKISDYNLSRDYPAMDATTRIGPHLRFGTISIRRCVSVAFEYSSTWLNELIWREFFIHILAFYPEVTSLAFKREYDRIKWLNDEDMFNLWCNGMTGYPLVDAGMRELNATGFMHNRVRMVTASFLVKHLLIDWRWGEAYFASKLLDYELASNNGNWQWIAGCGCDAAPYFRIFNPLRQQEKFDPDFKYVKKWLPEFGTDKYPHPVIEHEFARDRCIKAYKEVLSWKV